MMKDFIEIFVIIFAILFFIIAGGCGGGVFFTYAVRILLISTGLSLIIYVWDWLI